jgi:hypothetical protein
MIITRLGYKVPKWYLTFLEFSQVISGWTYFYNWAACSRGLGQVARKGPRWVMQSLVGDW